MAMLKQRIDEVMKILRNKQSNKLDQNEEGFDFDFITEYIDLPERANILRMVEDEMGQ